MKENLKLGIIVLITLSFVSTILPVTSAINITSKINANEVTVCEDREVKIKILEIIMLDDIDEDFMGWKNPLADFTVKITVEGDTWKCDGPDDDYHVESKELEDGGAHTWNVGQKDIVHIKIKLIDRDLVSDDTCDINGKSRDLKSVEFNYNIVTKSKDEYWFNGEDDGTKGMAIDDDDAYIKFKVSDNFNPKPKLSVEPQELSWNLKFNRNEDVSIPPKKITIKNIGDPGTTLKWSIKSVDDWYKVSPRSGELHTGESIVVEVDPKDSIIPGNEYNDDFYVHSKSAGDKTVELTAIVTKSRSSQYRETPLLHFPPGLMNLLQKINIIYSKFL